MPARARASAPSFIGWLLWPRTQVHLIASGTTIMSSCCQRSAFLTESLLTVRQPRAFHPLIQLVAPSRRYCESVTTSTAQARVSASSPLKAARISMRLFVFCAEELLLGVAMMQDRAPSAGAGIAGARAVDPTSAAAVVCRRFS